MTIDICRTSLPTALIVTISKTCLYCTENSALNVGLAYLATELKSKRLICESLWYLAPTKQRMVAGWNEVAIKGICWTKSWLSCTVKPLSKSLDNGKKWFAIKLIKHCEAPRDRVNFIYWWDLESKSTRTYFHERMNNRQHMPWDMPWDSGVWMGYCCSQFQARQVSEHVGSAWWNLAL